MVVLKSLGLLAVASQALASSAKPFTAEDMLSAPRPQPAIASPNGHHAISLVDKWDPKTDE